MTMQETILAIANDAVANGEDPLTAVQEYFEEKDSRFSKAEVRRILETATWRLYDK